MANDNGRVRLPAEERRQQIAAAARGVFAVHGLAGAKTRQIADAANVTETILYRHFASKDEIFEQAILVPLEQLATDLFRLTSEFAFIDPAARFEKSRAVHAEIFGVVREITPLLGVALFSGQTAGLTLYRERLGPMFDLSSTAMAKAMAPKQQAVVTPRTLFLALVGMYVGLALAEQYGDQPMDEEEVTRQLTELVAYGLFRTTEPARTTSDGKGSRPAKRPRAQARRATAGRATAPRTAPKRTGR